MKVNNFKEQILPSDLNGVIQEFSIKEVGGSIDRSHYTTLPVKPVEVYNVLTDKSSTYKPPDIVMEQGSKFEQV